VSVVVVVELEAFVIESSTRAELVELVEGSKRRALAIAARSLASLARCCR
jgi:hypothetical protein